jgi:acyl-coenzyme A synthetase/AMP-(fatty) acid ligase
VSLLDVSPAEALRIHSPIADHSLPALIDPEDTSRTLSYGQLAEQVAEVAATLPDVCTGRRLVHVPLMADTAAIRGYLAVLLAGHVPLVTSERADAVTAHYRPDLLLGTDGGFSTASSDPQHLLHPDLALLLSTSGSTGSPKLVRLSSENVLSNAEAIVSSLAITTADRAITSLPLHYCYGLSVLHAQLRAGASLVLRRKSFADADVCDTLVQSRVSMVAATPYLIDLMDVQGLLEADLPDLRLITQAGGALPAQRVREVAALGRTRGWSLVVMYGQTEATARMAVLPPESVVAHPDAVGWPIAGSSFQLDTTVPEATNGPDPVGELVFSGPGVMLGYAESPDDLALGRMQQELRTGDLGRTGDDGLVRVVGRRSDFIKIMGIRIDVGQVERELRKAGLEASVSGTDQQLQVTYRDQQSPSVPQVTGLVSVVSGLGPSVISVHGVEALPRLSNGKIDRLTCASMHRPRRHRRIRDSQLRRRQPADLASVAAALAPLVGRESVNPNRSFVELGGDSFCHVQASLRLGRLLGDLPADWHHRPLRELPLLAERLPSRPFGQRVEANVLLRAAAVIMICGSHVGLFPLAGGAHVLLAIAGFTFGRYVLSEPSTVQRWRRTARAAVGIVVPAVLVSAVMLVVFGGAHWTNLVMLHWAVRPSLGNIFWFVEALLFIMVATTLLLSLSRLRMAYTQDPWRLAFLLTGILLVPRYLVVGLVEGPVRGLPWTVAWLFTAGLAMSTAQTWSRKVLTGAVAAIGTVGFFPAAERNLVMMIGLLLLALVPTMVVPRFVVRPVGLLAAASLHVYLVQFQMFTFFSSSALKFAGAITAGLALWLLTTDLLRRIQLLVPLFTTTPRSQSSHLDP